MLSAIVTDPQMELKLPLHPGTMAVVHNHRVMHGRTAFKGKRGLCGCYVGDDEFRSTIRQLALQAQATRGHGLQSNSEGEGVSSDTDVWNLLLSESLGAELTPPHISY